MPTEAVAAYLRRIAYEGDLAPTYESLVALHRAHLDAVPYENHGPVLGRPPSADPAASLARVGEVRRAGYCFHQNGALELVLRELGFRMRRWHGHVHLAVDDRDTSLNHLVLEADGLPTDDNPGGRWWVDVGLGDAFREPLPITAGTHHQGGFDYEIAEVHEDGWSFHRSSIGTFTDVDIRSLPTDQAAVDEAHGRLSAPGSGRFAQVLVVQRRDDTGIDTVRGCLHHRTGPAGSTETELGSYDAWREALVEGTGLSLEGLEDDEMRALYAEHWAKHLAWTASGRP